MSIVQQQMHQIEALRQVVQKTSALAAQIAPSLTQVSSGVTELVGSSNQRVDVDIVNTLTSAKAAIDAVSVSMQESMAALSALRQAI